MITENSNTTEQSRIDGAKAALEALKKMDQILYRDGPCPTQEQYWRGMDEALSCVRSAAGDMPPRAEGVLMTLAEYIRVELTVGPPSMDSGWLSEAAMTHEEVMALRKEFDLICEEANRG
ncbi:MAG: hypothetical protein V4563_15430 [Pseudomonadota bacterium]